MRKKIKSILAMGVAASFALSCASQCFGASNLKGIPLTGTINQNDTVFNVSLPTNIIVLKPIENEQVLDSGAKTITNQNSNDNSPTSIAYDVTLAGYTITTKSSSTSYPIYFKTTKTDIDGYGSVKTKYVYLAMQVGNPGSSDSFTDLAIDQIIYTQSTKDYNPASANAEYEYTRISTKPKITVKPGESAPFRVTGTANPNAEWATGDQVSVTPVFKVNANLTAE